MSAENQDLLFFRSGLAKSAFHSSIYGSLFWQHFVQYAAEVQKLMRQLARVTPKIYQAHDAFLMHYQPYDVVMRSLKKSNKAAAVWHMIVKQAVTRGEFLDVNSFTRGSVELSILAAYQFLRAVFEHIWDRKVEQLQEKRAKGEVTDEQLARELEENVISREAFKEAVKEAVKEAKEAVEEYAESRATAEAALASLGGAGGFGYALDAISVLRFLQKPDDFRKRVRLLKYARVYAARFAATLPTSFSHEQVASQAGGVWGVGRMNAASRFSDILPAELALLSSPHPAVRAYFAAKLASRQLVAYTRATALRPVLFIDKSGSMAEGYYREEVPKISVAAGLAFAMHRKFGATVYLFDTELTPVKPKEIVNTLLTIEADGGTDVDPVLKEIVRLGKGDYVYIIISDGITVAAPAVLEAFARSGLAKRTKLILIPPAWEDYNWVRLLKQHYNVYHARDVAAFEKAVKTALSGGGQQ
jgi:uncharacterized protein with von Willebrand factor type A (vWA) domain